MHGEVLRGTPSRTRGTSRAKPHLVLAVAIFTTLLSAVICAVAMITPAPTSVVPLVVVICIGCPIFAFWQAPLALASLRADRAARRALGRLRRGLEQLPEVEHPLGSDG